MTRPQKRRLVQNNPDVTYFKPAGIRKRELEEIVLLVEEYEAIRLKDYMKLDQKECAQKMNLSQPTFHRLVLKAREKISSAIIEGKAIKIEGGNYQINNKDKLL